MSTVVTIDEMIQEVLDKADEVVANSKKDWPNDKEMIKMGKANAKDMRDGAELMKVGKFIKAYEKFSYMDTSAREQIPDNAWNYCQQKSKEHYDKERQ